jgi:ribosomal protein S6
MSVTVKRDYRAIVIFDTRGYEDPVDSLIEKISGILNDAGGEVKKVENLGHRDFVAGASNKHAGDIYAVFDFSGGADLPAVLKEKTRLDKTVYRVNVTRL